VHHLREEYRAVLPMMQHRFFKPGRVFMTLWEEPAGSCNMPLRCFVVPSFKNSRTSTIFSIKPDLYPPNKPVSDSLMVRCFHGSEVYILHRGRCVHTVLQSKGNEGVSNFILRRKPPWKPQWLLRSPQLHRSQTPQSTSTRFP
jgi:hypothetical protein